MLRRLAGDLDLDADAIIAEMSHEEVTQLIADNRALAQRMNITGTPSFVFGDTMVRGYLPLQNMQAIVRQARNDAG